MHTGFTAYGLYAQFYIGNISYMAVEELLPRTEVARKKGYFGLVTEHNGSFHDPSTLIWATTDPEADVENPREWLEKTNKAEIRKNANIFRLSRKF